MSATGGCASIADEIETGVTANRTKRVAALVAPTGDETRERTNI
jgi:hypothetical protein